MSLPSISNLQAACPHRTLTTGTISASATSHDTPAKALAAFRSLCGDSATGWLLLAHERAPLLLPRDAAKITADAWPEAGEAVSTANPDISYALRRAESGWSIVTLTQSSGNDIIEIVKQLNRDGTRSRYAVAHRLTTGDLPELRPAVCRFLGF